MGIFISRHLQKIDAKCRVSLPAEFRKVLGDEGVIFYPSYKERGVLEGVTMARMKELSEAVDKLDPFDISTDEVTTSIFGEAYHLQIDSSGRATLLPSLLKVCGLKEGDNALFVGRGKTFQMWNPAHFERNKIQVEKRIDQILRGER